MQTVTARAGNRNHRIHGQALTEFLVAGLFFIVPIILIIATVAKLSDVKYTAIQASRYSAWEKTVWANDESAWMASQKPNSKSNANIRNEIATRMVTDRRSGLVFKNTDKTATSFVNGSSFLWKDPEGKKYLEKYADLNGIDNRKKSPDILSKAIGGLGSITVPGLGAIGLEVPSQNLQSQIVSFDVAQSSSSLKRLFKDTPGAWTGMKISDTSSILTNTWMPNGANNNRDLVKGLAPMSTTAAQVLAAPLYAGMGVMDPVTLSGFDLGKIDIDRVPVDRLK